MQPNPPDDTVNAEAIPAEQPNAASPGPNRRDPPASGRLWSLVVIGIGALLGVVFLWNVLAARP